MPTPEELVEQADEAEAKGSEKAASLREAAEAQSVADAAAEKAKVENDE